MITLYPTSNLQSFLQTPSTWDRLAGGVPFRSTAWSRPWYQHRSRESRPVALIAYKSGGDPTDSHRSMDRVALGEADCSAASSDSEQAPAGEVVGILPLHGSSAGRRTTRRLGLCGDGPATSDYLSLLVRPENCSVVAEGMADYLIRHADDSFLGWNHLHLEGVSAGDPATACLLEHLQQRGASIHLQSTMNAWFKPCAESWEAFQASEPRKLRQQLRRWWRATEKDPGLRVEVPGDWRQTEAALHAMIRLHQQRWQSVGQPGSFATADSILFILDVVRQWHADGQLYLPTLVKDGVVIAAQLNVLGGDRRLYCYSMGVHPDYTSLSPGLVLNAHTLEHAHAIGATGWDMMRGDETYKQRLHANAIPMLEIDIHPPTWSGRAEQVWQAGYRAARHASRRWRGLPSIDPIPLKSAFPPDERYSGCLPKWVTHTSPFPTTSFSTAQASAGTQVDSESVSQGCDQVWTPDVAAPVVVG